MAYKFFKIKIKINYIRLGAEKNKKKKKKKTRRDPRDPLGALIRTHVEGDVSLDPGILSLYTSGNIFVETGAGLFRDSLPGGICGHIFLIAGGGH